MNKGFSLIEVITAIFILTVGIGGAFSLIYQTLSTVYAVRARLTASFLAQEGVEVIKNLRDSAWLRSRTVTTTSWLYYLSETGGDNYQLDYSTSDLVDTYSGDPDYLTIDSNGFFSYETGDNDVTHFTRSIAISNVTTNTIDVLVNVGWQVGGKDRELEIKETITNWYEK